MNDPHLPQETNVFDEQTWAELPPILEQLPEPLILNVWGEADGTYGERQAVLLGKTLSEHFDTIHYRLLPRRVNYPYYPVIGVMGGSENDEIDFGVRIIGLPSGYQMTSLITAIQAVSFRAATLEPITRIRLGKLMGDSDEDVVLELMTSAEDEGGPMVAKILFGLAVASSRIRSYLIMSDMFPEANLRYSVNYVPHVVINGRVHFEGVVDEAELLRQIARALGNQYER